MLVAIPLENDMLSMHFGHCMKFMFADCDDTTREVKDVRYETPPAHEPGALPKWLADNGVNVVITGGMGMRAQQLLEKNGIEVITGVMVAPVDEIMIQYSDGSLIVGDNACDH